MITSELVTEKQKGVVKWFSNQKGYGFIEQSDNPDIFVHHSAIQMDGFKTLEQGEAVMFDLMKGTKGPHAQNVFRT